MLSKGRSRQACLDVTGKEMMEEEEEKEEEEEEEEEGKECDQIVDTLPISLCNIYIYTHTHRSVYSCTHSSYQLRSNAHVCTVKAKTKVGGCAVCSTVTSTFFPCAFDAKERG